MRIVDLWTVTNLNYETSFKLFKVTLMTYNIAAIIILKD